jgi:hypothetical protein
MTQSEAILRKHAEAGVVRQRAADPRSANSHVISIGAFSFRLSRLGASEPDPGGSRAAEAAPTAHLDISGLNSRQLAGSALCIPRV